MLARLIVGGGLFVLGYLLGKEVGRVQPVRDELQRAREAAADDEVSDRPAQGASDPASSTSSES